MHSIEVFSAKFSWKKVKQETLTCVRILCQNKCFSLWSRSVGFNWRSPTFAYTCDWEIQRGVRDWLGVNPTTELLGDMHNLFQWKHSSGNKCQIVWGEVIGLSFSLQEVVWLVCHLTVTDDTHSILPFSKFSEPRAFLWENPAYDTPVHSCLPNPWYFCRLLTLYR